MRGSNIIPSEGKINPKTAELHSDIISGKLQKRDIQSSGILSLLDTAGIQALIELQDDLFSIALPYSDEDIHFRKILTSGPKNSTILINSGFVYQNHLDFDKLCQYLFEAPNNTGYRPSDSPNKRVNAIIDD